MDVQSDATTAQQATAMPSGGAGNGVAAHPTLLSLDQLDAGERAAVLRVDLLDSYGDRLAELGLTPGAAIEVVRKGWWQGPLVVRVRDYTLSLRREQAHHVCVARQG